MYTRRKETSEKSFFFTYISWHWWKIERLKVVTRQTSKTVADKNKESRSASKLITKEVEGNSTRAAVKTLTHLRLGEKVNLWEESVFHKREDRGCYTSWYTRNNLVFESSIKTQMNIKYLEFSSPVLLKLVFQCITVVFLMLPTESSMDDLLTHSCRTITKLRPLSFLAHGQQKLFTWMTARTCPGVCTVNNPSGGSARHFQRIKHKCTDFHMIRREATFPVPHLNPPRTLNNWTPKREERKKK